MTKLIACLLVGITASLCFRIAKDLGKKYPAEAHTSGWFFGCAYMLLALEILRIAGIK